MIGFSRTRRWGVIRGVIAGLALSVALAGCQDRGEEAAAADGPQQVRSEAKATSEESEAKTIRTPEDKEQLARELDESRRQAQEKLPREGRIDPETAKRMQDPDYRKQKDQMLSRLSEVSHSYFKQGIEVRHTRKRPEWRLIDTRLAAIPDEAERRQKAEELAKQFKRDVETVLDKEIAVIVFADASESIQLY